ncbi:hypothetical protein VTK73DRAFT_5800 [Phialemonium thermophilum]|uniref:Uncharacterized protein n=1 Tax=Phialemonium thermophilum TaxID=223376 RepID=A0ABR3WLR2_9PEZI
MLSGASFRETMTHAPERKLCERGSVTRGVIETEPQAYRCQVCFPVGVKRCVCAQDACQRTASVWGWGAGPREIGKKKKVGQITRSRRMYFRGQEGTETNQGRLWGDMKAAGIRRSCSEMRRRLGDLGDDRNEDKIRQAYLRHLGLAQGSTSSMLAPLGKRGDPFCAREGPPYGKKNDVQARPVRGAASMSRYLSLTDVPECRSCTEPEGLRGSVTALENLKEQKQDEAPGSAYLTIFHTRRTNQKTH